MCIVLLERKFVLIDQNSVHRPDVVPREGEETSGRHRRVSCLSLFISTQLIYRTRVFFPFQKKRAAVYLKQQGFIVHSRGNDTLSSNHLAWIHLGVAPSVDVTSTTLTEFLADLQKLEEISASMLEKFKKYFLT